MRSWPSQRNSASRSSAQLPQQSFLPGRTPPFHTMPLARTFTGAVDGIELAEGSGVMEECRAAW